MRTHLGKRQLGLDHVEAKGEGDDALMEYDNHEECQHIIYTVLQTHSKTFKYLVRRKVKILSNPRILE